MRGSQMNVDADRCAGMGQKRTPLSGGRTGGRFSGPGPGRSPAVRSFTAPATNVRVTELISEDVAGQSFPTYPDSSSTVVRVQLTGHSRVGSGTTETTLRPGDTGVLTSRTATTAASPDSRSVDLSIPWSEVEIPLAEFGLTAIRAGQGSLTGALTHLLNTIVAGYEMLDGHQRYRVMRSAAQLGLAVILDDCDGSWSESDPHVVLLREMYRHIEERLPDPDLDVNELAAAHHLSVRHVHNIFRLSGQSAAARIRERRVARACEELADPMKVDVPVATIATHWGFSGASHFGQVFKSTTGETPAAFRLRTTARRTPDAVPMSAR